jgi:hypothetical protein
LNDNYHFVYVKEKVKVIVSASRLYVNAHKKQRFVVAIKYEGETEYRYLVASDMSWRHLDIVQAYTLRWLVEVFFEDWKLYEGWGQLAKQPGKEGSSRGLTLSLLLDHCLLLHPEQKRRLKNKLPAGTVGSLRDRILVEAWSVDVPLAERVFCIGANASGKSNFLDAFCVILLKRAVIYKMQRIIVVDSPQYAVLPHPNHCWSSGTGSVEQNGHPCPRKPSPDVPHMRAQRESCGSEVSLAQQTLSSMT